MTHETSRQEILAHLAEAARKELTAEEREALLDAYDEWLFYERRMLHVERFGLEKAKRTEGFIPCTRARFCHFPTFGEPAALPPSTRAEGGARICRMHLA